MIKRRSGSVDNGHGLSTSFREDLLNNSNSGDEYFVPLVDDSRYNDYHDDASQVSYLSNDEQRLSPTLPLHGSTLPANPQSPGGESQHTHNHYEQYYKQQQNQYNNQSSSGRRQQRRYSNGSRPNSPLDNSETNGGGLPLHSRLVFTAHKRKSTFSFAVTSFCLLGFLLYGNARSSLRKTVKEVEELVVFSEKLHRKLRYAEREMKILEKELIELDLLEEDREEDEVNRKILLRSSMFANPELHDEKHRKQKRVDELQLKATYFREMVVAANKQDVIDKYGDGNIRVTMDLIFPPTILDDGSVVPDNGPSTIVMEMAPLDLMPHSVYTFLEMVSEGLIDGCSFVTNNDHTLKTAPLPYDGKNSRLKTRQFYEANLESVAFQEYSKKFPHKKHTVGFAGHGSPSFYINTEDNSAIHEDEPCFAKIVSGFDTVQRLDELPVNEIMLKQRIGIKAVQIL